MHIMFGMVVVPFIVDLVKKDENDKLEKAFSFFEDMINDKNNLVSEVVEFTILEDLLSSGQDVLDKCKVYMGNETLDSCVKLEHISC